MAHQCVAGELYESITGQLFEIGRQLRQPKGYPYDPIKLQHHLQGAIEGCFGSTSAFPVWMAITIGGVPKDELLARLRKGFFVSDWAKDIMSKPEFTTLPESTEIQLARATVKDLGFKKEPTITELFIRIKEVGDLCPAEVGPHLRLTDTDQPNNSWYWIAMEPITGSGGGPGVFRLKRYGVGERWLGAGYVCPGGRWGLGLTVVFRLSK